MVRKNDKPPVEPPPRPDPRKVSQHDPRTGQSDLEVREAQMIRGDIVPEKKG